MPGAPVLLRVKARGVHLPAEAAFFAWAAPKGVHGRHAAGMKEKFRPSHLPQPAKHGILKTIP